MKTSKDLFIQSITIALYIFLSASSCENDDGTINTPTDQSAADVIVGTYNGQASRWYSAYSSDCYTDASAYTKSGMVAININKVNDSTVTLQVSSIGNQFEPFPQADMPGYANVNVKLTGPQRVVGYSFAMGNAPWGYPYGSPRFTFQDNIISGLFDLSNGGCYDRMIATPNWSQLDGVEFTASK